MSTARRLAVGAGWSYGSQILTFVVQIGYAATTSRLVDAQAFGEYSIALTATGLFTLIASGGLSQSVGRMRTLDRKELRTVFSYALVVGCVAGVFALITSHLWAALWGNPGASELIKILAVNALTAPLFGVCTGLMRRVGEFKQLAIATVLANLVGMAVGLSVVLSFQTAWSLVVSAVVAQTIVTVFALVKMREHVVFGLIRRGGESLAFSWRLIVASLMQYITANAPRFGVANQVGAAPLGQWNRAEVLSTLPFQQLQATLVPVIYPEFRHDRGDSERAYRIWADLLALTAWVTVPLGVVASTVLPYAVPFILGSHWHQAGLYAIPLGLAGGIQPVVVLLASAVEALGHFRVIWRLSAFLLILQGGVVALVLVSGSVWPAVSALLMTNVVSHIVYARWCARRGLLAIPRLVRSYIQLALFCVALAICLVLFLQSSVVAGTMVWPALLSGFLIAIGLVVMARDWHAIPPVRLAGQLGLFKVSTLD